jgi:uncharacterized protein (DUF433 family)
MNYMAHFERNPNVCNGQWVIKGTRVPVRTLLGSLAEGASVEEILADFPTVGREDIWAVIAFAAAAVEEDLPLAEIPAVL